MPTVGEVVASVLPHAVALGPKAAKGPTVNWVRVMRPRVPAFDALESDDLVVVPEGALLAMAHDQAEAVDVADELVRAGVAGVLLVSQTKGGASDAAAAFIARAAAGSLPVFRADQADEASLERALIRYLVNERAELERQVARLEAELQAIALAERGLQAMAAAIAGFLGRAVAIEDAAGTVVALHAPANSPRAALAAARYERGRAAALRRDLPSGGRLALLGEEPTSELERAASDRVAVVLALEFSRDAALRRAGDRRETLPGEGPPWVVLMARQLLSGEEATIAAREERRERVRRLAPARRLVLRGDAASVELRGVGAAVPTDPLGLELAARVGAVLERPVAVSRPFREATLRPSADAEARTVLDAGDELSAVQQPPAVLRADRLPVYRLLGSLHNLPDARRHAHALLEPLLVGTSRAQRDRLATLRALLDGGGQAEAAARLRVHRNTLAYRVRRIEETTGWDLGDPDLRLVLAMALRIVHSQQI